MNNAWNFGNATIEIMRKNWLYKKKLHRDKYLTVDRQAMLPCENQLLEMKIIDI